MKIFIYFIFLVLGILMGSFISLISVISPIVVYVFLITFSIVMVFNLNQNKLLSNFKDFFIYESCIFIGIWTIVFKLDTNIQFSVLLFNMLIYLIGYYSIKYNGEKIK